jgi:LEA14-like dessication related protein
MKKIIICFLTFLCLSCKTTPEKIDPDNPISLDFQNFNFIDLDNINIHFILTANNPHKEKAIVTVTNFVFTLNGNQVISDSLRIDGNTVFTLEPLSSIKEPLALSLNIKDNLIDADEYFSKLTVYAEYAYPKEEIFQFEASNHALFPKIKEPVFEIISIVIMQADLINTQFIADVKITNPNMFAADLSSLKYELYGNGRFWASGSEPVNFHIPAYEACEIELHFSMNFINMSRKLLDDIIALNMVNYVFKGTALVDTGFFPPFKIIFEKSGDSKVVK